MLHVDTSAVQNNAPGFSNNIKSGSSYIFEMISSLLKKLMDAKAITLITVFSFCLVVSTPLYAQVQEDTTRTEREGPEQLDFERFESPFDTPYQFRVPVSEMNRYRLDDFGTTHGFYRRLNYQGFGEFLMPSEERHDPYGEEWVQQINQDLITLLELTFSEESQFLSTIARIGRFLTLGFFEPYEVPISRIDDPDRSHIESGDHEY